MRTRPPALLTVLLAGPVASLGNLSNSLLKYDIPGARTLSDDLEDFKKLDKYAHCNGKTDHYMVYSRNSGLAGQKVLKAGQDAGLLQEETVAIFGWTLGDFEFVNQFAWGADEVKFGVEPFGYPTCTLFKAEVAPYIKVIVEGLQKLPPAQPATLWRGSKRSAQKLGKQITGGFSSTSRNLDAAFNFVKQSGGSLWAIESHTSGKDISQFSDKPSEGEVLFPAGSRLEVVECSPGTVDDALRQKVKEAEEALQKRRPEAKIEIICMKGEALHLKDTAPVTV